MRRKGSQGFAVRAMRGSDLEKVAEIEARCFRSPWSLRMLAAELEYDWSTTLVAVSSRSPKDVVGFLVYWTIVDEVHILDLAVDPDLARRGIGSTLVKAMLENARAEGSRRVSLEVRRSNEVAKKLYREEGFRAVGVRRKYYVDEGEDAIIMELEL